MAKNIFVITGGSGFGKTLLAEHLKGLGYSCGSEIARELIHSEQEVDGELLPWKNPYKFQQKILEERKSFYVSVKENEVAFADRAIPDQIAFARLHGFGTPEILLDAAKQYRYADLVFFTPPWKKIFKNDEVRTETFEMACKLHNLVADIYRELSYQMVELPLLSVEERGLFIFQTILKYYSNEH